MPPLHTGQRRVATDAHRYRVLACGRRWGKTLLGAALCIAAGLKPGAHAWWIAPSFPMSSIGWRAIRGMAGDIPGAVIREGDRMAHLPGGGWVQVKSADNPDSLRGDGLDFAVLDECALIAEAAWLEALRPALSDRLGKALFISSPKGRNWFWRLWARGAEGDPETASFKFRTIDNPFIDPAEIEAARASLPERVFRQEYEAEFIDDAGGVFRGVEACATGALEAPSYERNIVLGVDWGKHNDFTVICGIDRATGNLVTFDRFNKIDYTFQRKRLESIAEQWRPSLILAESNAMGEPIIEELRRAGLPVQGFATTAVTKPKLIEGLALAIERREICYPRIPELLTELQSYEFATSNGRPRYNAPEGLHDDCVMALALAWHAAAKVNTAYYAEAIV